MPPHSRRRPGSGPSMVLSPAPEPLMSAPAAATPGAATGDTAGGGVATEDAATEDAATTATRRGGHRVQRDGQRDGAATAAVTPGGQGGRAGAATGPGPDTAPDVYLSGRVPRELRNDLHHQAIREGRPVAALLQDAVRAYLAKHPAT